MYLKSGVLRTLDAELSETFARAGLAKMREVAALRHAIGVSGARLSVRRDGASYGTPEAVDQNGTAGHFWRSVPEEA